MMIPMNAIFDPAMYTISGFWRAHNVNFIQSHKLTHELNLGPRVILIGDKGYVTREAAAEWRQKIEEYALAHGGKIEFVCGVSAMNPATQAENAGIS